MSMKIPFFVTALLLSGAGCVVNRVSEPMPAPTQTSARVEGVVIVGQFSGTEMACGFLEDTPVGARVPCNYGSVSLGLLIDDGREVWIDGYQCGAREIMVRDVVTAHAEYETSDCAGGLVPGERAALEGVLDLRQGLWRYGMQVDEWWMTVEN
ncbi:MAG: hypothetical protein UY95_C0035G0003 [Parcubacteria group bacterium GW2011_GWA2_56_7]|nr:MAG: hypothetical protein UY95_C0035G0003 [Parcubacteria group bacterium GW2011_GWA2_56_7]